MLEAGRVAAERAMAWPVRPPYDRMSSSPADLPADAAAARAEAPPRWRRAWLWGALLAGLIVAQSLLVALTVHYRTGRAQQEVEVAAANGAVEASRLLDRDLQAILALPDDDDVAAWRARADELMLRQNEVLRVERRNAALQITAAVDSRVRPPLFSQFSRAEVQLEAEIACKSALRRAGPTYSSTYFVPHSDGLGIEVIDVCIAERVVEHGTQPGGFVTATISLPGLLERLAAEPWARHHELAFVEGDGAMLAHSRAHVGAGVYRATRVMTLPGATLQLRLDSAAARPSLIPDLVTALVVGLSLMLLGLVLVLARDVRKRARVETALAESLALRKAMEDSLVTGLRARDLEGRIRYVNPAFCTMVGYSAAELLGAATPPYWPQDELAEYRQRQQKRLSGAAPLEAREAFETVFVHKGGERIPVMIFEAPLVNSAGRHAGWMSSVLDLTAQRRAEDLSRQQQDRLQAAARLATLGEMASLLSHELNQPLAAIAAYATGSLNTMDAVNDVREVDADTWAMLQQAAQRIAEQAERAGRVIKSVHDFVRRREHVREPVAVDTLFDAVLPLVRLQARKSAARIEIDLPAGLPRVQCDRAMIEQVLLNLARNGIQAMLAGDDERLGESAAPVLTLRARVSGEGWVCLSVLDRGPGIGDDVARRLFTPFFTTRIDGMGLGLSVCRTIVEQHGGALDFENQRDGAGRVTGALFRFTLPAARPRPAQVDAPAAAPDAAPAEPAALAEPPAPLR